MQDRPTVDELLRAVEALFDEQFVPSLTGSLQYNARVAANVIRTVRRELQQEESALQQEWASLDVILGAAEKPDTLVGLKTAIAVRSAQLSKRIRDGDADKGEWRALVLAHVRDAVHAKLVAGNPKWLESDA
jgi:hypothetical protein